MLHVAAGAMSAQQNLYKSDLDGAPADQQQFRLSAGDARDAWAPQVIGYDDDPATEIESEGDKLAFPFDIRECSDVHTKDRRSLMHTRKDIPAAKCKSIGDLGKSTGSLSSDYDDAQLTPSGSDASTPGSSPASHSPDDSPTEAKKEPEFSGYFAKRFLRASLGEHHDTSKRRHLIEIVGNLSETYRSYDDISEEALGTVGEYTSNEHLYKEAINTTGECIGNDEHLHTTVPPTDTAHSFSHSDLRDLAALVDATTKQDRTSRARQSAEGLKLYIPWNMDAFNMPLHEDSNNLQQWDATNLYGSDELDSGCCNSSERALHDQVGTSSSSSSRAVVAVDGVSSVLPGVPPPSPTVTRHRQDHVVHDHGYTQSTHVVPGEEDLGEEDSPPLSPSFTPRGSRLQQARSSIDYTFETWEEPYFDIRTGERILSTIYEFELSASEESDSDDDLLFRKGSRRASILVAPFDIFSVMDSHDECNAEGDKDKYYTENTSDPTVVINKATLPIDQPEFYSDANMNNFQIENNSVEGVTVLTVDGNMSKISEQDTYEGIIENVNSSNCDINRGASMNSVIDRETDSQISNESSNEESESIDLISHLEYADKIKLINEAPESAIEKIVSIMEGNDDIYSVIDEIVEIVIKENKALAGGRSLSDTPSPAPTEQEALEENTRREEDRTQKDRCLEVYPETLRQRQRAMIQANNKVDIKNWSSSGGELQQPPNKSNKKFLPSVKALRNQFESGKSNNNRADASPSPTNNSSSISVLSRRSSTSTSSLASSSLEKASSTNSLTSQGGSTENLLGPSIENGSPRENGNHQYDEEPVEPIFNQFKQVDEELRELMKRPPTTTGWNPRPLLRRLYYVPEAPKIQSRGTTYVNIEGYLEKLPSGRKKATFWNAWKRRYFVAKDGVLYYYQNNQSEKPSMKMSLMGGKVECMEPNMIGVDDGRGDKAGVMLGIDDGKGHYVVVRCSTRQEAERWRRALETHNVEDFASQYVQPWPIPTNPTLLRDTLVVDLGSASVRAGVLASNPTLPQLFFPSVVATERGSRQQTWGFDSLSPDIRSKSTISFPLRPSHKISKYSVDLSTVSSLLQKTFAELKVDPKNYHLQISVPRVLNTNTQAELLRILFEKFDVKSVNLTHQSILALYAYNATSGIVVDIGERMDIVPVIDGYIVDGGVSRVPYGGHRIIDHLRQFLYQSNVSLVNEVESYLIRYVLENSCYCAHHYNTEKARCTSNPDNFEKNVSLSEFFQGQPCPYTNVNVDFGRFQATEGLFNPDAWGLDHPGLHKLVHKAIQECSMDIRKEMSRSIFLSGGVSQLPGLTDRLTTELDNLTPPAIRPKVHGSPYRYHAAYLGGCVLAESPAFVQSRITREDWNKHGNMALRKWSL